MVTTPIGTSDDVARKVLVQADGKVISVGYSLGSATGNDFAVVRYNLDGTLDTTFGSNGRVTTDLGSLDEGGWTAALQGDGKIVVVGRRFNGTNDDIVVIRYNTNGTLDTSFGTGGRVVYDGGASEQALGVAIKPDGQIVVVGSSNLYGDTDILSARFDASGTLVGEDGFDYYGLNDVGNSVAIQSDGKYLIAGYATYSDGFKYISLVRYNADGSTDATFGSGGAVITAVGVADDVARSVLVQPNGKIIVIGYTVDDVTGQNFLVMRYNANGTLDTTFGVAGDTSTDLGSQVEGAWGAALQSDGKIIVVGSRFNGSTDDLVLIRYHSNGSIDTTFGSSGSVITPTGSGAGSGWSVALQSDGRIVVTGASYNGLNQDIITLRFNANGTIDDTFSGQAAGSPVITSNGGGAAASVSVAENSKAVATVTATDPDANTTLTYSIVGGADASKFQINALSGVLTFINAPNFEVPADAGGNNTYDVLVHVSDGSLTDTQAIAVTVTNQNEAPSITSSGAGATASVSVSENAATATAITATDPDASTTLTYSIVGGADANKFQVNALSGVLTFVNAPNFEAPADAGGNNIYDVVVEVSDGSLRDVQAIAVTVTDLGEAPSITSNGGSTTASVSVTENSTAVATVTATDPDANTTLTYSIAGGADAGKFAINALSGVLTFVNAPNFEAPADAGGNNTYDVVVHVSDGALTDTQAIAVTVTNQNEAPSITSNGGGHSASVVLADKPTAVTTVTATDPDAGTSLRYLIAGGADANKFQVNALSGVLTFVKVPDYEAPEDAGGDNIYDVVVEVSDGSLTDTQAIAVTVTNQNTPPTITSNGGGATASVSVSENSVAVTSVTGEDPNAGSTLLYSIVGGADVAKFQINELTGALTFVSAPDFEAPADGGANNVYDVVVQVSDGTLSDTQAIAVIVTNQIPEAVVGTIGDDTFTASDDIELFNGLLGSDTVSYRAASRAIAASLAMPSQNKGAAAGDTFTSIENLTGSSFNDTLTGDANANVLTGGAGVDKLVGGAGNDTYNVNLTAAGKLEDKVVETSKAASEVDRIVLSGSSSNAAAVTLKLGANIEDLDASATGTSRLNLTGSALANTIIGNAAANVISGAGGADTMNGRDGSDIYLISAAGEYTGDVISDSGTGVGDIDEIRFAAKGASTLVLSSSVAGIERVVVGTGTAAAAVTTSRKALNVDATALSYGVSIIGNSGANTLTGGSGHDVINGGAGNDRIFGGLGNDVLTGSTGSDSFIFNTIPNAISNLDTITDFVVADDTIELDGRVYSGFGSSTGTLAAADFVFGTSATDVTDRIIYDPVTGALLYDRDGNLEGGAVQIATLSVGLALTSNDFLII